MTTELNVSIKLLIAFAAIFSIAACGGGGGGGAAVGNNSIATTTYDAPASSLTAIQYKN
jgi:hypothetical protein